MTVVLYPSTMAVANIPKSSRRNRLTCGCSRNLAFDDLHIDIIAQAPRDERGSVELIEQLSANEDGNPNDEEEASEADIEANTVDDDANQEEVLEHTAQQDEPEVESTVDLSDDEEPVIVESEEDEATDAEPTEAEETDTAEENAPEAE